MAGAATFAGTMAMTFSCSPFELSQQVTVTLSPAFTVLSAPAALASTGGVDGDDLGGHFVRLPLVRNGLRGLGLRLGLGGDSLLGRLRRLGLLGLVGDGHAGHEDEGQQQGKLLHVFRNLLGNGADSPTCGT